MIPNELLEQAAKFADPVVIVDATFPGVQLPHAVSQRVVDGKLVIPIKDIEQHLKFAPDRTSFELDGVPGFFVPGGAILMLMDRKTGEAFTMDRAMLKDSN